VSNYRANFAIIVRCFLFDNNVALVSKCQHTHTHSLSLSLSLIVRIPVSAHGNIEREEVSEERIQPHLRAGEPSIAFLLRAACATSRSGGRNVSHLGGAVQ